MPALAARPAFATSWRSPISSTAAESVQLYSARMAGDPKSYRYRRRGDRNYSSLDHLSHGLILGNGEVNIVKKLDSDSRPADDRGVLDLRSSIASLADENWWCRPVTPTHTGAGEPVEVYGAGVSGVTGLLLRARGSVSWQRSLRTGAVRRWSPHAGKEGRDGGHV